MRHYHGEKKAVRFIADDQAHFVSRLGLALDATPALGGTRAKVYTSRRLGLQISFPSHVPIYFWVFPQQRFVIIAKDDTIETVIVEEKAGDLTVTEATKVLARL